jgi:hypothetical protein
MDGIAAKRERESAPVFVEEEVTGRHEGDDLYDARKARAEADPAGRIALLEADHKSLAADVSGMKLSIVRIEGHQETGNAKLEGIQKSLDQLSQREHIKFTATVDVDKARELDTIEAKKDKRKLWLQIVGIFTSGGLVFELLHRLGVL